MCSRPIPLLKEIAEFCEIEWNHNFEIKLKKYTLKNTNDKYRKELNLKQQKELNCILNNYLKKFDY